MAAVDRDGNGDNRKPYLLRWVEQNGLFRELPSYLLHIALFKVNTGCRKQEVLWLAKDGRDRVGARGRHLM